MTTANADYAKSNLAALCARLRQRGDFADVFAPFLQAVARLGDSGEMRHYLGRPLAGYYCSQTPVELLDAMGYHPVRLPILANGAEPRLPTAIAHLACPLADACLATVGAEGKGRGYEFTVLPVSCDWIARIADWLQARGSDIHVMEVPRSQASERSQQRWLEEVRCLLAALEKRRGRAISRRDLQRAIAGHALAWELFARLRERQRQGRLSGIWAFIAAQAWGSETRERWRQHMEELIAWCDNRSPSSMPGVFVGGSPTLLSDIKILEAIETAGLHIADDNLCVMDRLLVGPAIYEDTSLFSLCRAIAERHYIACTCPTGLDALARCRLILDRVRRHGLSGIVYVIQRGCHPCAAEALTLEQEARRAGIPYLRLEAASSEATGNWLVRLEAFRETISQRAEERI